MADGVPIVARNRVIDFLNTQISHFALGTDGSSETDTATALGNEVFRKGVTDKTIDTEAQTLTVECFIGAPEANGNTIREVGLFDQPAAGDLFAIKNFPEQIKTASLEWLLNVVIEVQ